MTSLTRPPDEFANCLTHAVGFVLSLAATGSLMTRVAGHSVAVQVACGVYSLALLLVYGSSTLSHLCYDPHWRRHFRTWDQACIFLLIVGSGTPFALIYLHQGAWLWLLGGLWVLAGLGVGRVLQVGDLSRFDKLSYGLLGYLPVIAIGELSRQAPSAVVWWIVAGGACYTAGVPFLCRSASMPYAHAVWHLLVMSGSACHYWAILLAVSNHLA